MKNTTLLFILGQGSLAMALIIKYYFAKSYMFFVFLGLFTSLSIIFNIAFLIRKIKEMKAKSKDQ